MAMFRQELSSRGLSTKGLKKELADRLQAHLDAAAGDEVVAGVEEDIDAAANGKTRAADVPEPIPPMPAPEIDDVPAEAPEPVPENEKDPEPSEVVESEKLVTLEPPGIKYDTAGGEEGSIGSTSVKRKREDEVEQGRQEREPIPICLCPVSVSEPAFVGTKSPTPVKEAKEVVEPPAVEEEKASLPNEPVPPAEPERKKPKYEEPAQREKRRSPPPVQDKKREATNGSSSTSRVHPATPSLYVSNLVRPFTLPHLKELLQEHGELEFFWIDKVKSHVYVTVCLCFYLS
jgi:hypothetical protein